MKHLIRAITALALAALLALGTSGTAQAETILKVDTYGSDQPPALDVKWARFTYAEHQAIYVIKFARLTKKTTQAVAQFRRPAFGLLFSSRWRADGTRVLRGHQTYNSSGEIIPMRSGLSVRWDFARDKVTFKVDDQWLTGQRAFFSGYSVAKGQMHGPYRGDYLTANPYRG